MQFVPFICTDPTGEPYDEASDDVDRWFGALQERGKHLAGDRLRPVEDAITVRVRGGGRLITDGPFAETREWIAGFNLIEADDLDEAIELATDHARRRGSTCFAVPVDARRPCSGTARASTEEQALVEERVADVRASPPASTATVGDGPADADASGPRDAAPRQVG
jgi:hypothetical protein